MLRIAFLAISQAHQFLHWLPAALRLAREPGVEVTVLGTSAAGLDFIRSYDPDGLLRIRKLWVPSFRQDGLFSPPKRRLALHPRPCIYVNFDRIAWQGNENYAHWHLGQVIEHPEELASALERAQTLQPGFEAAQVAATIRSIDPTPEPASERQARAILSFAQA